MTRDQSPLMSGTRLFLNVLLIVLYVTATVLAIVTATVVVSTLQPNLAGEFTAPDALTMVPMLAFVGLAIAFFRLLRAIVRSVAEGDPFDHANPARVMNLGWLALSHWVINLFFIMLQAQPIGNEGELAGEGINQVISLVGPITLFILARVFRHGAAMREDLDGTV